MNDNKDLQDNENPEEVSQEEVPKKLTSKQRKILFEHFDKTHSTKQVTPPWASGNPSNPGQWVSKDTPPNAKCPCGSGKKYKRCCSYK